MDCTVLESPILRQPMVQMVQRGRFKIYEGPVEIYFAGTYVRMPRTQAAFFAILFEADGKNLPHEALWLAAYPGRPVKRHRLATELHRLKKMLPPWAGLNDGCLGSRSLQLSPGDRENIEIRRLSGEVHCDDVPLISPTELALAHLFAYLLDRGNTPSRKHEIMAAVWPHTSPNARTHTLETHMTRLRKRIEPTVATITNKNGYILHLLD